MLRKYTIPVWPKSQLGCTNLQEDLYIFIPISIKACCRLSNHWSRYLLLHQVKLAQHCLYNYINHIILHHFIVSLPTLMTCSFINPLSMYQLSFDRRLAAHYNNFLSSLVIIARMFLIKKKCFSTIRQCFKASFHATTSQFCCETPLCPKFIPQSSCGFKAFIKSKAFTKCANPLVDWAGFFPVYINEF